MQVILSGYYGFGNGGDEALLATLLQMLPAHVSPLVLSANPQATTRQYQVKTCDRNDSIRVFQAIRQSQAFIWGGGSLIQDATSAFSPVYYIGLMGLAQGLGLKTIAWAQGIGPLQHRRNQWLARRAFRGCTAISVRDPASAEWVSRWQVPHHMAPDPVWSLTATPVPWVQELPSPKVALVLRSHPQLTPPRLENLTTAITAFQAQTQTHLLLIPFQATQDAEIAKRIRTRLPKQSSLVSLTNPRQLKGVFAAVDMTIAMRLHGLIMAAAAGNRCFALSYDPKVREFMTAHHCPGWDLDQIPDDPQVICQQWLDHYHQGQGLSEDEIGDLTRQALIHQQVLQKVLS
ncbi:MAG: polysaccharide pyruvyl transferase CsaB [Acaryochloris sp. RU_4_1]|nr:polysaccharide pyruvyl transferase CsaB [Acaryochloris sp. RU_4_1]NJR56695.1 polysaccharide pyruvyl transferase CsaB [Acaryochloris sp. CRU_2_0]